MSSFNSLMPLRPVERADASPSDVPSSAAKANAKRRRVRARRPSPVLAAAAPVAAPALRLGGGTPLKPVRELAESRGGESVKRSRPAAVEERPPNVVAGLGGEKTQQAVSRRRKRPLHDASMAGLASLAAFFQQARALPGGWSRFQTKTACHCRTDVSDCALASRRLTRSQSQPSARTRRQENGSNDSIRLLSRPSPNHNGAR